MLLLTPGRAADSDLFLHLALTFCSYSLSPPFLLKENWWLGEDTCSEREGTAFSDSLAQNGEGGMGETQTQWDRVFVNGM